MSNESSQATYRILDASINRAGEGLRTMEDFARFALDDAAMTSAIKSLRHDLTAAMSGLDRQSLLKARDTAQDIGTEIQVPTEYWRQDAPSVIKAAASRTQQSLRVLEEFSKLIDPAVGAAIEQVRYRTYTVCADLELQCGPQRRRSLLAESQLYALIDAGKDDDDFTDKVRTLANAGVQILQLRDHHQTDRVLFQRAKLGSQIARQHDTLFIVNDRADIAVAAGADGVHVGQDELPAKEARQIVGADRLVGVSTHDIDQVHQAIDSGADYIGCGPVFPSQTKSFDEFAGTAFLQEVHDAEKQRPIPAFAIGGINVDNVHQITATGFHRIAVTGAIASAPDPANAVKTLLGLLTSKLAS
ncbi:MAG: thiamine phosphate synthase [Pirellulaceae bacterium]